MKIIRLSDPVQPPDDTPSVVLDEASQPLPGPFELLIRVRAAGVIVTELSWYPTSHRENGDTRAGAVPGHEFSGVIAGVGENVGCLELGCEVFGMNGWFSEGAMAEYCLTPFFAVARKPTSLSNQEAASVPISALTAWQGLFDRAMLQAGERILIQGGAGAVGSFAVQLARWRGAHVTATASEKNLDLIRDLGADDAIDYKRARSQDFEDKADVVFDTVGGETLEQSWGLLKANGRLVTVAATGEGSADARVQ